MYVWAAAQRGISMQVNVIGASMFVIAVAIVLFNESLNNARTRAVIR